jgi:hypothetical protein
LLDERNSDIGSQLKSSKHAQDMHMNTYIVSYI